MTADQFESRVLERLSALDTKTNAIQAEVLGAGSEPGIRGRLLRVEDHTRAAHKRLDERDRRDQWMGRLFVSQVVVVLFSVIGSAVTVVISHLVSR